MTVLVSNDLWFPIIRDQNKRLSAKRTIHYLDRVSRSDQVVRKIETVVEAPPIEMTSLVHLRRWFQVPDERHGSEAYRLEINPLGGATLRFAFQILKDSNEANVLLVCHAALAICSNRDHYIKSRGDEIAKSILENPKSYRYLVFPIWWPKEDLRLFGDSWVMPVNGERSKEITREEGFHHWLINQVLSANACQYLLCETYQDPEVDDLTRTLASSTFDSNGDITIDYSGGSGLSGILSKRVL
jgi:hypothetical protein